MPDIIQKKQKPAGTGAPALKDGRMEITEASSSNIFNVIFDVIPSIVLVVDEDVRIIELNQAAAELAGIEGKSVLKMRGGEALHCLHARDVPMGCGHGPSCAECVLRSAVGEAYKGVRIVRRRHRMELAKNETVTQIHALITAGQFLYQNTRLVLLIIEDISEIIELQSIIPICAICKKVRDDSDYWIQVESYFRKHMEVDFSHGLCPDCLRIELARLRAGRKD
ncbi:MAG: PAS domain-containing protein [Syntrophobacteraceae bacterium]